MRSSIQKLGAPVIAGLVVAGALTGCWGNRSEDPPVHLLWNMDNQDRWDMQEKTDFFPDGRKMRPPVEGTVAREDSLDPVFATGKDAAGGVVASSPVAVDEALLARGKERFEIYCTPCHGARGDGKGVLFERAQIAATDLRLERLQQAPDGQIFDVISNGLGLMAGYKYPIPAHDRWAIIAHVRELQKGATP
ncbi:MAG: cytochrome c [Thermoanaerobaculia bacterium]|nr:cytochrome c [Thermoanaerobaculia bacterium]